MSPSGGPDAIDGIAVKIPWVINTFRGDKFEELWTPVAETVVHYGATAWAFMRSKDDPLQFEQWAIFPSKLHFERWWYSEEAADARVRASGLYQVPVLPEYLHVKALGRVSEAAAAVE
jgi:hypothetical protein